MFKNNFIKLCVEKGVAPTAVCQQIGLSNAAFSSWTDDSVPRRTTLIKIADYFQVPLESLLSDGPNEEQKETAPQDIPEGLSQLDAEIIKIYSTLPEEKKQQALSYLEFLRKQGGE